MATQGKRILVIDDEKDQVDYLTALLTDLGYVVDTAGNGNQAMDKLKAALPDLITLDVVMPDKTGVKFYRELKDAPAFQRIPVIFITGITPDFEKFISNRRSAPAPEGYLAKPFDPPALVDLVKKLLDEAGKEKTA